MLDQEKAEAELLKKHEDVKEALKQTSSTPTGAGPGAKTEDKLWFGAYALLLIVLGGIYYLLDARVVSLTDAYQSLFERVIIGAALVVLLLVAAKSVDTYVIAGIHSTAARYNLRRILKLLAGLLLVIVVVSLIRADWYTLFASVGLVSLVLGLALQTPLTSFFAWIYILARRPYRVGDRIEIGDATGDVIDVSYLDTTLWEFGGKYLSTDHPSGRIIKFPNSRVLTNAVYNYSWPLFPYIWNEIKFNIAYQSDLEFVATTMQEVAEQEIGQVMMERVRVYRELLAQTPVDRLEVQERPVVHFRVSQNTWLEAIVRYIVHPKESGRVKTRLIKKLLERLNAEPERVMFPNADLREEPDMEYKLFINGQWVDGGTPMEVRNKYTNEVIGTVPIASRERVDEAIGAAQNAAAVMAEMPAHKRADLLMRTAQLLRERRDDIAKTIAAEMGKALKYARIEADRAVGTFTIAAEEAKRIHGETVPLDALPAGEGYFGFYVRRPVGVVAAISPFNFPLNLVAHKVAPALAAGNSLVLKPASSTPLSAVKLVEILNEAGLPPGAINLIVGPGSSVGEWLVTDPRVAKITFTGSADVGRHILSVAGIKKVTLELGNTSPVIVASDADLDLVAKRTAVGAYYNSGQVCLSVQRIYADPKIYEPFTEKFVQAAEAMVVGDPLDERVDVGPMIDTREVDRIEGWVKEAQSGGARVLSGGKREGPVYYPTVLADVSPEMKVVAQEAFAPVASVIRYDDFEDALAQADKTEYGLQAAVFTRDINRVFQAIKRLNFGGIIINDTPTFRADQMPYGGTRQSGLGREGLLYAIEEMTNIQMVAIRLTP